MNAGRIRASSVVLLSGGLDSAANLALCRKYDDPILAITVNYGQRAAARELEAAQAFCRFYGVSHHALDLPWLGRLGGNALTDPSKALPDLDPLKMDHRATTEATAAAVWVANRNGILIQVAAAYAESLCASRVVVGFNSEEATTFPDNTGDFLNRSTSALALSTRNQVQVFCYTIDMDKTEIVRTLLSEDVKFPWEKIWSCYRGIEAGPCNHCESCRRLERALSKNLVRRRAFQSLGEAQP